MQRFHYVVCHTGNIRDIILDKLTIIFNSGALEMESEISIMLPNNEDYNLAVWQSVFKRINVKRFNPTANFWNTKEINKILTFLDSLGDENFYIRQNYFLLGKPIAWPDAEVVCNSMAEDQERIKDLEIKREDVIKFLNHIEYYHKIGDQAFEFYNFDYLKVSSNLRLLLRRKINDIMDKSIRANSSYFFDLEKTYILLSLLLHQIKNEVHFEIACLYLPSFALDHQSINNFFGVV